MQLATNALVRARTLEVVALTMVGDGLLALLEPRRHMMLWRQGPKAWRDLADVFVERPTLTRVVGAATMLAGLWLATRQRA